VRPDRNTSTKYLKRSRRAHTFISTKYLRRSRRTHTNYKLEAAFGHLREAKILPGDSHPTEPQIQRRTSQPPQILNGSVQKDRKAVKLTIKTSTQTKQAKYPAAKSKQVYKVIMQRKSQHYSAKENC
jgi:hypothetical protein